MTNVLLEVPDIMSIVPVPNIVLCGFKCDMRQDPKSQHLLTSIEEGNVV